MTGDEELLHAHLRGDPDAFTTLIERHHNHLWAVALRTCGNPHDAADALQETLISAYQTAGQFRGDGPVAGWLHRIAANTCIDWLRRRKVEEALVEELEDTLPDEGEAARREAREAGRRLEAAMAVLGPGDRRLVALLALEGKSVEEVAALTGLSRVNVKVRAFRARRKLKAFLEKYSA